MSEEKSITTAQVADPAWERARQWVQIARLHECRKLIAQVMTGFELLALHQAHKVGPGQPKKESCQIGTILFKDLMERELQIPARTGWRWMRLARAMSKKLETMDLPASVKAALAGAPDGWSAEDSAQIARFIDELAGGKTQSELLAGSEHARKAVKPSVVAKIAALPASAEQQLPASRLVAEYAHLDSWLNDAELAAEVETLEKLAQVFRGWLATEWNQRDVAELRAKLGRMKEAA